MIPSNKKSKFLMSSSQVHPSTRRFSSCGLLFTGPKLRPAGALAVSTAFVPLGCLAIGLGWCGAGSIAAGGGSGISRWNRDDFMVGFRESGAGYRWYIAKLMWDQWNGFKLSSGVCWWKLFFFYERSTWGNRLTEDLWCFRRRGVDHQTQGDEDAP